MRNVIISVSDKSKLDFLVKALREINPDVKIISSGGTARFIKELGSSVIPVSDYTGYPEMPGGLVKTLHPKIHGGLLGELDKEDQVKYMEEHGIEPIDLMIGNLYPFEKVIQEDGITLEKARQNIDIGGPSMIRSAAKNFYRVCVIVDPVDYEELVNNLKENNGVTSQEFRMQMSIKAFSHVEKYNKAIKEFLGGIND